MCFLGLGSCDDDDEKMKFNIAVMHLCVNVMKLWLVECGSSLVLCWHMLVQ
jgi:hypothetical protein